MTDGPIGMVDVVRKTQSIALAAERGGDPETLAVCRRTQPLLARSRNDVVEDLIGGGAPSERAA